MLSQIKTEIGEKLKDKGYRHRFFKGRAEDEIAFGLRRYRQLRGWSQSELAQRCGMKQSAISRIEQASYSRWNLTTLWRIADALDVRVRVAIDDAADAIREYEQRENIISTAAMFANNLAVYSGPEIMPHLDIAMGAGVVTAIYCPNITAQGVSIKQELIWNQSPNFKC